MAFAGQLWLVAQPMLVAAQGIMMAALMVCTVCTPMYTFHLCFTGLVQSFDVYINIGTQLSSLLFVKKEDGALKQGAGFDQVWVYERNGEVGRLQISLYISLSIWFALHSFLCDTLQS